MIAAAAVGIVLAQELLRLRQTLRIAQAVGFGEGPRKRRSGLVVVQIEELLVRQFGVVVLALRPLIEFTANRIDAVVDTLTAVGLPTLPAPPALAPTRQDLVFAKASETG